MPGPAKGNVSGSFKAFTLRSNFPCNPAHSKSLVTKAAWWLSYLRMSSPGFIFASGQRFILIPAVVLASLSVAAFAQSTEAAKPTQRQPVLVELFTSEGCSDCPPADALLARLDAIQFLPDAHAIVLSEHVTYWNHLGWRDPFSFDQMDERQQQYTARFAQSSPYTPQMVVDGTVQFVGSDVAALTRAVTSATAAPKVQFDIEDAHWEGRDVRFSVRGGPTTRTTLVAALAEDATRSEVGRGENAGRTLHHVAVVRVLKEFDSKGSPGVSLRLSGANLSHGHSDSPIRLVVFLA